jgi:nucleotide-binding universal stress UspA family protein
MRHALATLRQVTFPDEAKWEKRMKHLLCCFDGSEHADVALAHAVDLAKRLSADLSILVVNVAFGRSPRGPYSLIWTEGEAAAILAKACEKATGNAMKPTDAAVVVAREASTGIIDYALDHEIDGIVIGTGDKRGLSRLFLGSVAMDVANRAPCTVIIVR